MAKILIVEDEEKMRHLLSIMAGGRGHEVDQAADGVKAMEKLSSRTYDMVISDIKMPNMDGMALLEKMQEKNIFCPMVFITAFATVESAVEAMRSGAVDYITKPFEEQRILLTIERTLNLGRIVSENRDLKLRLKLTKESEEIIYVSREMSAVMELAAKVAGSDSAVLIHGESGTGKEVLAKFIHKAGGRAQGRFVPVNCAAISPGLVESELFGHEKGAYTGADKRSAGKFEFANGGTLFLDEIGDLPLEAQAKLLRALQEKKIQRVGGNEEIPVDARVVCATNRSLEEMVAKNDFRRDLFFRINVFPMEVPPLRERMDDVIPLAEHFLKRFSGGDAFAITNGAAKTLLSYNWPGNVRELANAMERSVILEREKGSITANTLCFLNFNVNNGGGCGGFRLPPEGLSLEELEKEIVRQALEATGNNQMAAARLLGLTRAKFRVLMKQLDR